MEPQPKWERTFRNFNESDGLLSSKVFDIEQDSIGFMWFATDKGLCRYDGEIFEEIGASLLKDDNCIYRFAKSKKGDIWFITSKNNVYLIDKAKPKIVLQSKKVGDPIKTDLLIDFRIIHDTIIDLSFRETNWLRFDVHGNKLRAPAGLNGKNLLFDEDGVFSYNYFPVLKNVFDQKTLSISYRDTIVRINTILNDRGCLIEKIQENIYLVANGRELYVFKPSENIIEIIFKYDRRVNCVKKSNGSDIWIGLSRKGVFLAQIEHEMRIDGSLLNGQSVTEIFYDNNNGTWIASLNSGLYFSSNSVCTEVSANKLSTEGYTIRKQFDFENEIIFSLSNGELIKYDLISANWYTNDFADELELSDVVAIGSISNDQILLVDERGQIVKLSANGNVLSSTQINGTHILQAEFVDSDTIRLYASESTRSYCIIDNSTLIIDSLRESKRFLFSNQKAGVHLLEGYGMFEPVVNNYLCLQDKHGMQELKIASSVPFFEHDILLATNRGHVFRYNLNQKMLYEIWTSVSKQQFKSMGWKNPNKLWILIGSEVVEINYSRANEKISVSSFELREFFGASEVININFSNSQLIGCTKDKIYSINITNDLYSRQVHKPFVRYVYRNNEMQDAFCERRFSFSSSETITLKFSTIEFSRNDSKEFQYRFTNSSEWKVLDNSRLNIGDFFPGNYNIEVRCKINNNEWSESSFYSIQIRRDLVANIAENWKYLLLAIVAILLLLRLIWHLKSLARNKELVSAQTIALRSQLNPHFIFNSLNSIQHMVLSNNTLEAYKSLSKFSRLMRNTLDCSELEYVGLTREIDSLFIYLELERSRLGDKLSYEINLSEDLKDVEIEIPPMLIQPFVENAVWHGIMNLDGAVGKIILDLHRRDDVLLVTVSDNGVGRKNAKQINGKIGSVSHGLAITNSRLRLLSLTSGKKATYMVANLENEEFNTGTVVRIKIPYKLKT